MSAYLKNFRTPPAEFFVTSIAIEKLINAEGPILVKLPRVPVQDSQDAVPFSCLSFITEFIG
jgi:hypothetical protein